MFITVNIIRFNCGEKITMKRRNKRKNKKENRSERQEKYDRVLWRPSNPFSLP
jgi:uncharacterized protein Veg